MRDENVRMYREIHHELNQLKRLITYACSNSLIDDSLDAEGEINA